MLNKGNRAVAAALLLVWQLLAAGPAGAAGIGITPALVQIDDALRGTAYQQTMMLTNNEDAAVTFEVHPAGEVGAWAAVFPFDGPETPVTSIVVPAQSDQNLRLKIDIPADAANGPHAGQLRFQTTLTNRDATSSSSLGVSVGLAIELRLTVTGEQKLAGELKDVSLLNVEVDQPPLRIVTTFLNAGNVKANPQILFKLRDEHGNLAGEATFAGPEVERGAIARIVSEWDHTGKPVGKYTAAVTVQLGGQVIGARDLSLQILPRGALTRAGALRELRLENQPQAGGTAKLVGVFQNTGTIDTKAVLVAEVQRDGSLLKVMESRERLIPAGQAENVELFLDTPQAGQYTVKAKVNFEGKVTEVRELEFSIAAGGQTQGNSAQLPGAVWALTVVGGLVLCGAAVELVLRARRRSLRVPERAVAGKQRS